jgi:hypothetical protein
MLDLDQLNNDLRAILLSLFGIADANFFRPANQNSPAGKINVPFSTVLVSEVTPVGVDQMDYADVTPDPNNLNQSTETTQGPRHIVASIQFFRSGALTKAARLGSLLRSSAAWTQLQAKNFGLVRVGPVTNVSAVVDSLFEERAQVEVELYCVSKEQATVPTFGTFPVSIKTQ